VVVGARTLWLASVVRGRGVVYLPVCIEFKLELSYHGLILDCLKIIKQECVEWFRNVGSMRLVTSAGHVINTSTRTNYNQLHLIQEPILYVTGQERQKTPFCYGRGPCCQKNGLGVSKQGPLACLDRRHGSGVARMVESENGGSQSRTARDEDQRVRSLLNIQCSLRMCPISHPRLQLGSQPCLFPPVIYAQQH
jgi:hypothetical protein